MVKSFKKLFFAVPFLICILGFCGISNVFATQENIVSQNSPKLSIIMPVYNVAQYLDGALDSAENQTLKDLEIICVNDGSTDNSLQILEEHAAKDERIKIINQENKGVSEARNAGLMAARGEYVHFFDSDDLLVPYAMEKAVENLEKYNADALEFNYALFKRDEEIDFSRFSYDESKVVVNEYDPSVNPFSVFDGSCFVWTRVYRRSFLNENSIWFNKNVRMSEDVLFSFTCSIYMKSMIKSDNIGYCYRQSRPGSAVTKNPKNTAYHAQNHLMIIKELVGFRDRVVDIKRKNIDNYFVSCMLGFVRGSWGDIKNIKDLSVKQKNAKIAYEEIAEKFVKKYKVKLSTADKNKLNDLKCWSEPKKPGKKVEKTKVIRQTRKLPITKKAQPKPRQQSRNHNFRGKK